MIDRHHLLECILWPNEEGTFRKIVNTQKRLEELGIYDDFKLTIPIEHGTHVSMHAEFKKGTEFERSGKNHPMYGRTGERNPMYGRSGEKSPWYGKTRDKSPVWKGDKATPSSIYIRELKRYKRGEISEEELQVFRDLKQKFKRERRLKCQ